MCPKFLQSFGIAETRKLEGVVVDIDKSKMGKVFGHQDMRLIIQKNRHITNALCSFRFGQVKEKL